MAIPLITIKFRIPFPYLPCLYSSHVYMYMHAGFIKQKKFNMMTILKFVQQKTLSSIITWWL